MDHRPLLDLATGQHGLVSAIQLMTLGYSPAARRHLVTSGRWIPASSRVLVLRGAPVSKFRDALAGALDAGHDAAVSHATAARLWGLQGCAFDPVTVVRTARTRRSTTLADVREIRALPPTWCCRIGGVPIVRPELLALQMFAIYPEGRAERLTETMWSRRLLSGRSLSRFIDDYGERGRNGTAGIRAYLEVRGRDYTPAASGLESRVLQILRGAGITMDRQVDSGDDLAWTGRVDFRHPDLAVILEVQSEAHHDALVDRAADRARLTKLRAAGYIVVEATDVEAWSQPAVVVERVRAAIERAMRA